jgi:hypothetical protein
VLILAIDNFAHILHAQWRAGHRGVNFRKFDLVEVQSSSAFANAIFKALNFSVESLVLREIVPKNSKATIGFV